MKKNSDSLTYSAPQNMVEFSDVGFMAACSKQTNPHQPIRQLGDDITWEILGGCPGFLAEVGCISVAFVGKIPYVAYTDGSNKNKVNVKKLDAATNSWELVGNAHFSGNYSDHTDIAFNGDVPYIVYADGEDFGRIKVKKLKDNSWETVGDTNFSGFCSSSSYITFNNGEAYIVYQDGGNSNKITVRKYNTIHDKWDLLGEALSGNYVNNKLIFINNIPYLSYGDGNKDALKIEKFNGKVWENVGEAEVYGGSGIARS